MLSLPRLSLGGNSRTILLGGGVTNAWDYSAKGKDKEVNK